MLTVLFCCVGGRSLHVPHLGSERFVDTAALQKVLRPSSRPFQQLPLREGGYRQRLPITRLSTAFSYLH